MSTRTFKSNSSGVGVLYKNGSTTYDMSTASGVQTIPHGLGTTPKLVKIAGTLVKVGSNETTITQTSYDGVAQSSIYTHEGINAGEQSTGALFRLISEIGLNDYQTGVITVDATNIYITWTKTNSPTGTADLLWEAEASSVSGSVNNELKVGVGAIKDTKWFNMQVPFLNIANDYWAISGTIKSPSVVSFNNNSSESINMDATGLLLDFDLSAGNLQFFSGKQTFFQTTIRTTSVSAPNNCRGGIGFDVAGASVTDRINDNQGTNKISIGFVRERSTGDWFTRSADGSNHTEHPITLNPSTKYILRVEYDPANATPQARFYVDGLLVDTITTNLPTAQTDIIGFSAGNGDTVDSSISFISAPSFAVEI